MSGVDDELGDEVLFAGLHAEAAGATSALLSIGGDGRALEVAGVGDGDGDLLVGDEVFELEFGGLVDDLGAAGVAVLGANFGEFFDDEFAELCGGGEDGLELGDVFADLGEFFEELIDRELGEAVELQFEDGVDLLVAEDERAGGEKVMSTPYFSGSRVTPLSSVPRRLIFFPEKYWKRFSRASARLPDWRMVLMTLSR